MQQCCWIYPENNELSSELIKEAGSRILARLLLNRGIDSPEKIKEFLYPETITISSPFKFTHMEKAVERINKAIEDQEHIVIYGDFDADGVTSTSLLYKTLTHLKANVSYYIPDRTDEGHGLNSASICRLISAKKAKLIITVDCGISNLSEITLAKGLGTDIIITDHHEPAEILPPAFAIINPKVCVECSEIGYLAGVGVAFKLASALLEKNKSEEYIDEILHLVALGTIADVVPLLGENRALVYRGLKVISQKHPQAIIKLLQSAGYKLDKNISAEMIAFGIAPRINAVGRLAEASLAVELLTSEDEDEIELIIKKLNHNNRIRQQMCESTFLEANSKVNKEIDLEENKAIILSDTNWHAGIIGIVASKLAEKYYRPVFLISVDKESNEARCSARSIEGVNLHEILLLNKEYFLQSGGHAKAAGFSVDLNKENLDKVISELNNTINEKATSTELKPSLKIDTDIAPSDLSTELIQELDKLSPCGEGNSSPVLSMSNLTLKGFKTIGANNNHLKILLIDNDNNTFDAVWWGRDSIDIALEEKVDVAFSPEINLYAGKTNIQLVLKDIKKVKNNSPILKETFIKQEFQDTPKWIDHRKKTDVERFFSNYIKTSKNNTTIFAENGEILKNLSKYPLLLEKIKNRFSIEPSDELVIFDIPADIKVLSEIIENSKAKLVHLAVKNYNEILPVQIIKTFSGMLKYAYTNKDGVINIPEIASRLSTSNMVIKTCINLLNAANIIKVQQYSDSTIKYDFIGSADLTKVVNLKEYRTFCEILHSTESFRQTFITDSIENIQNSTGKFSDELVKL